MHFLFAGLLWLTSAQAFDSTLLFNNKESGSRELSKKDFRLGLAWPEWVRIDPINAESLSKEMLEETMNEFVDRDGWCDIGLSESLAMKATKLGLIKSRREFPELLRYLRANNLIDDLLYRAMVDASALVDAYGRTVTPDEEMDYPRSKLKDIDLKKTYAPFTPWPDEVSSCSIGKFNQMVSGLTAKDGRDRDAKVQALNALALEQKVIDDVTYSKLEALRVAKVSEWNVYTAAYVEVVMNAKDKLAKTRDVTGRSEFTETYASRKEKLTQRGRLYKYFDSTQIVMMAQLLEKTSRRLDATRVSLTFEYKDPIDNEIYVLSPMEQYRISINMLKKDMAELMRSENFRGKGIQYEDLVAAAFETGLIHNDELGYILKFEDFWNPKTPRWKTYTNFAFSIAGTAVFYLPPPWNIVGALALIVTQSTVNGKPKPDPNDNWNVII